MISIFVACEGDFDDKPLVRVHSVHTTIGKAMRAASALAKKSEHVYWHALEVRMPANSTEPKAGNVLRVEKREGQDPIVIARTR